MNWMLILNLITLCLIVTTCYFAQYSVRKYKAIANDEHLKFMRELDKLISLERRVMGAPDPKGRHDEDTPESIDYIALQLVTEEHDQGMEFGTRGHCEGCNLRARFTHFPEAYQRVCKHPTPHVLASPSGYKGCGLCGTVWKFGVNG